MAIDRSIEHNKRDGFGSLCAGGLRMDSFPMKLFRKGNKKFWNPEDIDFSRDAEDFAAMTEDEKLMTGSLAARFMAGEESVTQDIQPFMHAMAAEGRLADEAYLAQFAFEEAKHMQGFRMWFDAVGLTGDLHDFAEYGPAYDIIFKVEQPKAMWALIDDPSPAAQIRASVTYNHIVEGCLALTGYFAWAKVCNSRGLLPGMQKLIKHIGDDERRHMAWGTFTCRRHVAASDDNWSVVEQQMGKLMEPALALTNEIYGRFEGRETPFGIDEAEMAQYAADKLTRRMESIQGARGRDPREIDEDYSPMDLEDRFGDEDAKRHQEALVSAGG
ncbi:MAG: ribonucleoside-diphosphate reductase beta chain [Pseudonocardiales bacterium]|jgi:ribonucleoside-diphosphate reductase beta chain|nr:ribonucleoside-diphosphate reductase beta chain [Pseudonocardiales bacterium]MDT7626826.1 ribonucleoside-diphosphate reductase beta chain [Pseudonocardiales bacterium]MDT7673456.1 ribonucleoside-diphosphate reductase beta chain [Pseudonocardiales bacterium]